MSPRQRSAAVVDGGEGKDALENMATAIRELVMLTNRMLQYLEENRGQNGNGNCHVVGNGDVLGLNPQFYGLTEFKKMHPLLFRGEYNPTIDESWLMHIEKKFEAMVCTDEQKVTYAAYMLVGEAKHWWKGTKALLQAQEIPLSREQFKMVFWKNISQ